MKAAMSTGLFVALSALRLSPNTRSVTRTPATVRMALVFSANDGTNGSRARGVACARCQAEVASLTPSTVA